MKLSIPLEEAHDHPNLAAFLEPEKLVSLGQLLVSDIERDVLSRAPWEKRYDEWIEMAEQVANLKNTPWPGASNVKYPALSIAAIQFNARAYPALFGNKAIFKGVPLGVSDEDKVSKAVRVGTYMSVQVNDLMPNWMEENDRMLILLPIVGTVFRKTSFSEMKQTAISDLIEARDLIVNYHARDFATARKTHRLWMGDNDILGSMNMGIFLHGVPFPNRETKVEGARDKVQGLSNNSDANDEQAPYEVYECHCWLDLDADGYKEPYVVTLFKETGNILRIVPRWDALTGTRSNQDGDIYDIVPDEYFTCYKFLPDPTTSIYGVGFGNLIGTSGEAINTMINQLIDAGTMSVMQSGFLGRGTRIAKGGIMRFGPGDWKQVQTTGDDLRKSVMPLPAQPPSNVLFQLLGMLVESTATVTSVQDMMLGKNPGQNQPYSTSKEVLTQGLKVFNGIYKRIYRGLSHEARVLFEINRKNPNDILYDKIIGKLDAGGSFEDDFDTSAVDIIPTAEPDMVHEQERILKNEGLLQKLQLGLPISGPEVTKRLLQSEGHEDIEALMNVNPQASPEQKLEERKQIHQEMVDKAKLKFEYIATRDRALRDRANAVATVQRIDIEEKNADTKNLVAVLDQMNTEREALLKEMEIELRALEIDDKHEENMEKVKQPAAAAKGSE